MDGLGLGPDTGVVGMSKVPWTFEPSVAIKRLLVNGCSTVLDRHPLRLSGHVSPTLAVNNRRIGQNSQASISLTKLTEAWG